MLAKLRELVATTKKDVGYLRPLAEASRDSGLTIATLNYDLSIEQIAEDEHVRCSTGVEEWLETGRWEWPDVGIRLLKLHGSINWNWARAEEKPGHLPQRQLTIANQGEEGEGAPAVVFGNRGKLRAEGHFLGLLGEFESLMSRADHLLVIGYSFRDEHVNEVIRRWTSEDIKRRVTVVDPYWPDRFPRSAYLDFPATMQRHLISYREEFEPRLNIIKADCSRALQDLFS